MIKKKKNKIRRENKLKYFFEKLESLTWKSRRREKIKKQKKRPSMSNRRPVDNMPSHGEAIEEILTSSWKLVFGCQATTLLPLEVHEQHPHVDSCIAYIIYFFLIIFIFVQIAKLLLRQLDNNKKKTKLKRRKSSCTLIKEIWLLRIF
jgi:hypothetical protein